MSEPSSIPPSPSPASGRAPPPPPPPPADSGYSRAAMVGAVLLWAVTAAAAFALAPDRDDGAYGTGYSIGAALGGLFLAAVIRLVYVRLTPWGRGKPDVAPALFVLAAALTALGIAGRHADREEEFERFTAAADGCAQSEPSPLARAPAGVRMGPVPGAARAQLDQLVAGSMPDDVAARLEFKQVLRGGRPAGVAMAMPGLTGADRDDFEVGFSDGATAQGAVVEETTVAGAQAIVAVGPRTAGVATYQGCWTLVIYSADRDSAEGLTEEFVDGGGA